MNKHQTIQELKYTSEILSIIDNKEDYTRSDLQGIIQAIVKKILLDKDK